MAPPSVQPWNWHSLPALAARRGVYRAAQYRLAGSHWKDPAAVSQWAVTLPTDREVVVYCVYGHEVSRATSMRLRAFGLKARYLHGGIEGWQAAGLTVEQVVKTPQMHHT